MVRFEQVLRYCIVIWTKVGLAMHCYRLTTRIVVLATSHGSYAKGVSCDIPWFLKFIAYNL